MRGRPEFRAVPVALREQQVLVRAAFRRGAAVLKLGETPVLYRDQPLIRAALLLDGAQQPRRRLPIALLTGFDVEGAGSRQRLVRRDGRPCTAQETELIGGTTDEDIRAAASQLAAAPQRLTELIAPYIRAVAEDTGDRRPPAEAP